MLKKSHLCDLIHCIKALRSDGNLKPLLVLSPLPSPFPFIKQPQAATIVSTMLDHTRSQVLHKQNKKCQNVNWKCRSLSRQFDCIYCYGIREHWLYSTNDSLMITTKHTLSSRKLCSHTFTSKVAASKAGAEGSCSRSETGGGAWNSSGYRR